VPGADALRVRGGRVAAVGGARELLAQRGAATRMLDARGATVTPGMTDAHLHLLGWARARRELDLSGAPSSTAVVARVAEAMAVRPPATPVVVGRGWDANDWSDPPHRAVLDCVSGGCPVLLYSRDFHNLWVNSAALAALGVDRATPDPEGGRIVRDASGDATGVLAEHAMRLAAPLEPPRPDDWTVLGDAVRELHAQRVTAVHDF